MALQSEKKNLQDQDILELQQAFESSSVAFHAGFHHAFHLLEESLRPSSFRLHEEELGQVLNEDLNYPLGNCWPTKSLGALVREIEWTTGSFFRPAEPAEYLETLKASISDVLNDYLAQKTSSETTADTFDGFDARLFWLDELIETAFFAGISAFRRNLQTTERDYLDQLLALYEDPWIRYPQLAAWLGQSAEETDAIQQEETITEESSDGDDDQDYDDLDLDDEDESGPLGSSSPSTVH